jgi:hypothetical protein
MQIKPINCGRIRGDEDALLGYLHRPDREQESFLELGAIERRHWMFKGNRKDALKNKLGCVQKGIELRSHKIDECI